MSTSNVNRAALSVSLAELMQQLQQCQLELQHIHTQAQTAEYQISASQVEKLQAVLQQTAVAIAQLPEPNAQLPAPDPETHAPSASDQANANRLETSQPSDSDAALRQQAQRERILRIMTQRIRQSLDLDEILAIAVDEVRETLQTDRALIFQLLPGDLGTVTYESVAPQYRSLNGGEWVDICLTEKNLEYYLTESVRNVPDVEQDDDWAQCLGRMLRQIGVKSKASAPIVQVNAAGTTAIWGLLIVHSCGDYRQWQQFELDLLQQMAIQIAIALQQANLYQQVKNELAERQQVEAQLRYSLREKEVLLKEIHHRVKNNMQMISSMLNLQADSIEDAAILHPFIESQQRVKAMALIHEKLYQSSNLAQLNFADYIQQLVEDLLHTFQRPDIQIQPSFDIAAVQLTVDIAIPCGLIVNELVSNALKYAFPHQSSGIIRISFMPLSQAVTPDFSETTPMRSQSSGAKPVDSREMSSSTNQVNYDSNHRNFLSNSATHSSQLKHQFILSVWDNGVGVPNHIDIQDTETLGLQIVHMFVKKLRGTITLDRTEGSRFNIVLTV